MNESCHTHTRDTQARVCVWHDSFIYVQHDPFVRVMWLIHVWHDSFICAWHDLFVYVTWLIHVGDMTHLCVCDMTDLYVWCDSFKCVPLVYFGVFDAIHSRVWHDSSICVWHDPFICVTWLVLVCVFVHSCRAREWLRSHKWMTNVTHIKVGLKRLVMSYINIWMSHVTRMNESRHTYI